MFPIKHWNNDRITSLTSRIVVCENNRIVERRGAKYNRLKRSISMLYLCSYDVFELIFCGNERYRVASFCTNSSCQKYLHVVSLHRAESLDTRTSYISSFFARSLFLFSTNVEFLIESWNEERYSRWSIRFEFLYGGNDAIRSVTANRDIEVCTTKHFPQRWLFLERGHSSLNNISLKSFTTALTWLWENQTLLLRMIYRRSRRSLSIFAKKYHRTTPRNFHSMLFLLEKLLRNWDESVFPGRRSWRL